MILSTVDTAKFRTQVLEKAEAMGWYFQPVNLLEIVGRRKNPANAGFQHSDNFSNIIYCYKNMKVKNFINFLNTNIPT